MVKFTPIKGQPEVSSFFQKALESNNLSHAYLFVGPSEDTQIEAARNIAKTLIAQDIAKKRCASEVAMSDAIAHVAQENFEKLVGDDLAMIDADTHPDVREYEPASAVGYLSEQIGEIIEAVQLASARAAHKIFILRKAERLGPKTANALLKTLEEPPADVIFILQTSSESAVLPTIRSRSQVVRFKAEDFAALSRELGTEIAIPAESAFSALSIAGSYEKAKTYALDKAAQKARRLLISTIAMLNMQSTWQLLKTAKQLSSLVGGEESAEGANAKSLSSAEKEQRENIEKEFLSSKAQKELEKQRKREIRTKAHDRLVQLLCAAELFLRDVMVVQAQAGAEMPATLAAMPVLVQTVGSVPPQTTSSARPQTVGSVQPQVTRLSQPDTLKEVQEAVRRWSSRQVVQGIRIVQEALRDIQQNVSARLAIEAMLLHMEDVMEDVMEDTGVMEGMEGTAVVEDMDAMDVMEDTEDALCQK